MNSEGTLSDLQSEEVLDLRAEDEHRDAAGETHRHRIRDELDHRAHPGHAHDEQQAAGHDGADGRLSKPYLAPMP